MKSEKITWEKIYNDFKLRHPKICKRVLGYEPYGYAEILIIFPDRVHIIYNYDTKETRNSPKI